MCHPDAGAEADVSPRLNGMQLGQNPGCVGSERGQHFTVAAERSGFVTLQHCALNSRALLFSKWLLCHCDQAHVVFGVAARLGVADDVDRVLLSLKPCWQEVSISHVLTVVHAGECKSETVERKFSETMGRGVK